MKMASVRVAVRARPLNARELELQTPSVVSVDKNVMRLMKPQMAEMTASMTATSNDTVRSGLLTSSMVLPDPQGSSSGPVPQDVKQFSFDHCFWSCVRTDKHYASQQDVYRAIGADVVSAAYDGYNACVFAYGQTGSGKTYTMTGNQEEPGLTPRICEQLFGLMQPQKNVSYRTTVSYMEIYNENVLDLLNRDRKGAVTNPHLASSLKVREHPKTGPYVQDLTHHTVSDYNDIKELMARGNRMRHTASTKMNDTSSRSHAIFTIVFTQAKFFEDLPEEKFSKIHLVDLAGSERAQATGATGQRLKEGGCINRSLVLLGNVICVLAEKSNKKDMFVPYRNSTLTFLLKDSLGGNSKTVMIATVSPAACNYSETLSTLRYASRAKAIINRPQVNEDSNVKVIRELRAEIAWLRQRLSAQGDKVGDRVAERLQENEARVAVLEQDWASRWSATMSVLQQGGDLDLRRADAGNVGVVLDSKTPYLACVSAESCFSTGLQLFQLKLGENHIGSDASQTIVLRSSGILPEHCCITMEEAEADKDAEAGGETEADEEAEAEASGSVAHRVLLVPHPGARCLINNAEVEGSQPLPHGCHVTLGDIALFRFNNPAEAQRMQREGISNPFTPHLLQHPVDVTKMDEKRAEAMEDSEQKLIEKRRELAALEEKYSETERHYHLESQKKEKELEAKRRRLEELQNCLEDTRTRLVSGAAEARNSSMHLDCLRNCRSPAQRFHMMQADLKGKFDRILNSELAKLGEESRQLEEQRAADFAAFAEEEAALRSALEEKRQEREAVHSEMSSYQDDLVTLDDLLKRGEMSAEKHAELYPAVKKEVAELTSKLAGLDAALNDLTVRVPAQLAQLNEQRESRDQELSEASRDLELRESALRRELQERLNRELADLVEELVRGGVGDRAAEEQKNDSEGKRDAPSVEHFPNESLVDAEKEVMTLQVEVQAVEESLRAQELEIATEEESVEWKRWQVQALEDSRRIGAEVSRRIALAKKEEADRLRAQRARKEAETEEVQEREAQEAEAAIVAAQLQSRTEREEEERRRNERKIEEEKEEWRRNKRLEDNESGTQLLRDRWIMQTASSSTSPSSEGSGHRLRSSFSSSNIGLKSSFHTRSLHSLTSDPITVNITICRFLRRQNYIEYEMLCQVGNEEWVVCRRYSRLRQFHEELRRQYPEIKSISFPPRLPFWVDSRAEAVAESRVAELQGYFERVVGYLQNHPYCLLNPMKSRVPICKTVVCKVLPILQIGDFESNRFGTA